MILIITSIVFMLLHPLAPVESGILPTVPLRHLVDYSIDPCLDGRHVLEVLFVGRLIHIEGDKVSQMCE